jgi:hypothetical protein
MRLTTEITAVVPEEVEFMPLFSVELTDEGVLLKAKSPLFANYFRTISKASKTRKFKFWPGEYYVDLDLSRIKSSSGAFELNQWDQSLVRGGIVNLSWLSHVDLGSEEGMTFLYPDAMSYQDMEDFFTLACEALRDIYLCNLRKAKLSVRMAEVIE